MTKKKKTDEKKTTRTMYIREVPETLWSEIKKYCDEKRITRRQFIERAFEAMKGIDHPEGGRAALKIQEAEDSLKLVKRRLDIYAETGELIEDIQGHERMSERFQLHLGETMRLKMQSDLKRMKSMVIEQMCSILEDVEVDESLTVEPTLASNVVEIDHQFGEIQQYIKDLPLNDLASFLEKTKELDQEGQQNSSQTATSAEPVENPASAEKFEINAHEQGEDGPMLFEEKSTPERRAKIKKRRKRLEKKKKE